MAFFTSLSTFFVRRACLVKPMTLRFETNKRRPKQRKYSNSHPKIFSHLLWAPSSLALSSYHACRQDGTVDANYRYYMQVIDLGVEVSLVSAACQRLSLFLQQSSRDCLRMCVGFNDASNYSSRCLIFVSPLVMSLLRTVEEC